MQQAAPQSTPPVPNQYEAKQDARRARYLDLAERMRRASVAAYASARKMAEVIPFGQPILVGHHSEKSDRNYRARIQRRYAQGDTFQAKAAYYASRAASVGRSGISSDDPEAVAKLSEKLARLEATQARMKSANVAVRRKDQTALTGMGFSERQVAELLTPDYAGRLGFPAYALTNNGAEIRRVKARIEALRAAADRSTVTHDLGGGISIIENADENRLQVVFPAIPAPEVRKRLKGAGFRWSPTAGAWQRHLNNGAKAAAVYALGLPWEQLFPNATPEAAPTPEGPDPTDLAHEDACAAACGLTGEAA